MDVEAVLKARDANASATFRRVGEAAGRAQSQFERLQGAQERLSGGFENMKGRLETLAATIGIGFGIHELWDEFVGLNAEEETATRSLGGMLSGLYKFDHAKGIENLEKGIARSKKMMEDFQRTALRTGVPTKVLAQTARELAPGFSRARASTAQLGEATKQVALLTKLIGGDTQQSAMAMSSFLQYGMAMRSPLLMQLGLHGRIYAQMSAQARLALLMKRIKAFGVTPEALEKVQTYDDLIGRIKAEVGFIQQTAGKPLFEAAKREAAKLAEWLSKNEGTLEKMGSEIAGDFVKGLHAAVTAASFLAKHMEAIKTTASAIVGIWAAGKLTGGVSSLGGGTRDLVGKFGGQFSNMAKEHGKTFGVLASGAMLAQAGIIGWEMGKAIDGWLQQTSWWGKMWEKGSLSKDDQDKAAAAEWHERREKAKDKARADAATAMLQDVTARDRGHGHTALRQLLREVRGATGNKLSYGGQEFGEQYLLTAATKLGIRKMPPPPNQPGESPNGAPSNNFYNSRFDITQQFAPGFDPDRVAAAFTSDLALLADQPRQAHAGRGVPFQRT